MIATPSAAVLTLATGGANPNVGGGPYFPFANPPSENWTSGMRRYGSGRDRVPLGTGPYTRSHAGCDLYAPFGTPIYAVDDGEVIQGSLSFYAGTHAVVIKHQGLIVRYGEIKPGSCNLSRGSNVEAGQKIAQVGRMNGVNNTMLHFEMYNGSVSGPLTTLANDLGKIVNGLPPRRRGDLIDPDPTPYLNHWSSKYPTAY